ncbi:MAG: putative glutathione S-transferase [Bradymonadia bacterium]|jgi:putative glutathione S-transferase
MGKLVNGEWTTQWYAPDKKGQFVRPDTVFRDSIESGGRFAPESGRYHLYLSNACPWAHRTRIHRALLGLEEVISISIVDALMGDDGWVFTDNPGTIGDPIHDARFLRDIYTAAQHDYTGRVTVPVLWDRKESTIVNNESREIIRMMNSSLAPLGSGNVTLWDAQREAAIDAALDAFYEPINNGVYRAGFATSQAAYDGAVETLFDALDYWEDVLSRQRFVVGNQLSEADICLFTTLIRFDSVYHGHFKCNRRRIVDYEHLSRWMREVHDTPGVAGTINMDHIMRHYYWSHDSINPTRVVPVGPATIWRLA